MKSAATKTKPSAVRVKPTPLPRKAEGKQYIIHLGRRRMHAHKLRLVSL